MNTFLRSVAADLIHRFGDDLHKTAIIFNNKRPVSFLKKHLGELSGKAAWSPSFFTVSEFFADSSAFTIAEPIRQFFVLHTCYNELLLRNGREPLSPARFYPMAEIILSDFSQIDYDLVPPEEVFSQLRDIALIEQQFSHFTEEQQQFLRSFWSSFSEEKQAGHQQKFIDLWTLMPDLYRNFRKALHAQGLCTSAQMYRDLAGGQAAHPDFTDRYPALIFIGFNALNRAEAKLFRQWQDQGKALFYFDTDAYYLDDKQQEAGLFLRRNLVKTGLKNSFETLDSAGSTFSKPREIDIYQTIGHVAQAKAVQQIFQGEKGLPADDDPEKTAIVLGDESLLVPLLQSIPSDTAKVNVTMGYPFAQSTVFGLIEVWLSVQEQVQVENKSTVYYRDVEAFLSHPLLSISRPEQDHVQQLISKNGLVEVPLAELHFATSLAPNFFTVKAGGLEAIDALYVLLTAVLEQRQKQDELEQLEAALLVEVARRLNQLYDGLSAYAAGLELPFVFSLIRRALQGLSVPLEGEPLRGIQVMGLLETRSLDFERVIILGVNEGVLPKTSASPSFIPDSLRRAYGLPVPENQDAIFAYLFYRLMQRSATITFVYNALVDENNSGEPSRFLKQLQFESPFRFRYRIQEQAVQVPQTAPVSVAKTGLVKKALARFFENRGRWDDEKISASGLTTYLSCRLQFFFRYVARIREPEELPDQVEANQIGTILHQVMEWFYSELVEKDPIITAERIHERRKDLPFITRQAMSLVLLNDRYKLKVPNAMQAIVLRIVEQYTETIIRHDEQQVAPFRIVELENKKDYRITFPVTVEGQTRQVNLYGIIDRVDDVQGRLRVVDYKSGGRDAVRYHTLEELFERDGKKQNKAMLQTLFYVHIYEQVRKRAAVEPNLYIVRKMDEGTRFHTGTARSGLVLEADSLEEVKTGFQQELQKILNEIFDPEISFDQTENRDVCAYCAYRQICQR
ncbi:MAG: PD-(D/E)XK nuclease family protein [Mucilaginibacter polytrichastri]|nr:PD-(D/E)XK nuclease family protein [Mucilaginibacter polytrichastri]